ncbi:MAG: hypothetical protein OXH37_07890 [Gammaproteobacteria bacterium]|nr:hypothetical protein [Gammaproteobacteria bacterium]
MTGKTTERCEGTFAAWRDERRAKALFDIVADRAFLDPVRAVAAGLCA